MARILMPAVFLDRDGTINVEKKYLFRKMEFVYLPGVVDGLKELADMGFLLVIITNQSGIARGFYTEEDYGKLNKWMLSDLRGKGVEITSTYYCPHHPDGVITEYAVRCNCRKPATGLFHQAEEELGIDMKKSFAIGDKLRDLAICRESKVKGILLGSDNRNCLQDRIWCCDNFKEAVEMIRIISRTVHPKI